MPDQGQPTGQQMCELIAEHWRAVLGVEVAPKDIWNYHPNGELAMVFLWYESAKAWKESQTAR